jgi:hypothetical protein
MLVELSINGKSFRAECQVYDNYVVTYGERGSSQVDLNGFSALQAAKQGLRNLVRNGEIDPVSEDEVKVNE